MVEENSLFNSLMVMKFTLKQLHSSNNQDELLKWAEEQAVYKEGYKGKYYSLVVCHHMNTLDKRVRGECVCEWVSPYGFIPEAGCPDHDKEETKKNE